MERRLLERIPDWILVVMFVLLVVFAVIGALIVLGPQASQCMESNCSGISSPL